MSRDGLWHARAMRAHAMLDELIRGPQPLHHATLQLAKRIQQVLLSYTPSVKAIDGCPECGGTRVTLSIDRDANAMHGKCQSCNAEFEVQS